MLTFTGYSPQNSNDDILPCHLLGYTYNPEPLCLQIQDGIGDKIGMFIRFFMTFLLAFVYAFIQNWLLTLVLCATIPIIIILGIATGAANWSKTYGENLKNVYYY